MDCHQPISHLVRVEEEIEVVMTNLPGTVRNSQCDTKCSKKSRLNSDTGDPPNKHGPIDGIYVQSSRVNRQLSLPLGNPVNTNLNVTERRRRSSPTDFRAFTNRPANTSSPASVKYAMRNRYRSSTNGTEVAPRPVPGSAHPSPICLEPIPQGQELNTNNCTQIGSAANFSVELAADKQTGNVTPCCACRIEDGNGWAEKLDYMSDTKNGYFPHKHNTGSNEPNDSDRHHSRGQSHIPGSQWAKDFIGRLRSNSSLEHAEYRQSEHSRRPVTSKQDFHPTNTDGIDPKRLPKTSGPASNCLQFAKKPFNLAQSPSCSTPIPVANNRHALMQTAAMASSSVHSKNRHTRVRWLSQSSSVASGSNPSDAFFGPSSLYARLSCSAVEAFQGAVDILSGRKQPQLPSGVSQNRSSVRVKRASESDRFLVISKSLSGSREDFSPCALEHFDENHVYNTLFRHSTCYDVLPESGKMVILDSHLGIVKAIRALLENGVPAAPIWHSATQRVTGLLSQELSVHLLTSLLCYSDAVDEKCSTPTMTGTASSAKPTSIADGLRHWGSQQLCEVLRIFHSDPDKSRYSPTAFDAALIVSPQTGLKRALCRLIHHLQRSDRGSRCYPSPMDTSDYRSLSSSVSSELGSSHRPCKQPIRQFSDPLATNKHTSTTGCDVPVPSPTHLIVMNRACGNVLGVLGVDRLLAYLRLRLDELPCSPQLLSTIDGIPGLRWTERQRLFRTSPLASRRGTETEVENTMDHGSIPAPPIVYPTTSCREALCSLTQWLVQLPAIPVINAYEGAAASAIHSPLIGLLAPGDLLHFFLDGCPDTAANQPIGKILDVKLSHCRFLHECVCHTQETLMDALDRMFRLRTPCLVLFNAPTPHNNGSLQGPPIGMLTAKDLLCAIVGTNPYHHHHHHHHHNHIRHASGMSQDRRSSSNESKQILGSPMDVFEDVMNLPPDECSALGDTLGSSSSSDESSSSSRSTYSAHSDKARRNSGSSQRSSQCSCACHVPPASRTPAHHTTVEEMDVHLRNPGLATKSSSKTSQAVRFAEFHSTAPGTKHNQVQTSVSDQRKHGRRGDEDDSLFPMD